MKLFKNIFLVVLGGVITFLGNHWHFSEKNEIPYIDQFVTTDLSVISKEKLLLNDLKILVGKEEKEVDKISQVSIYLVNYSNKFFKDLEVNLKINNPDSKIKFLSMHSSGENNVGSIVIPGDNNGIDSFNYTIKTVKRTNEFDEFFKLILYYEGDYEFKESDFTLTVLNDEARTRKFDRKHSPKVIKDNISFVLTIIGVLTSAIVLSFLAIMVLNKLLNYQARNFNQVFATRVYEVSSKVDLLNDIPDEKRKTVISQLLYEKAKERRQRMNKLEKFLDGNAEPKLDDHKVLDEI